MKYTLKAYSIWEQGPREKQEDSLYPKHGELVDTDRLFILCDGMGGHSAGEIASSTVCSAMSDYILSHNTGPEDSFSDDDFNAALDAAYDALDKKDNGAAKKMGTTLTFLKLHDAGCTIAHIGDSRVYHIRPGEGPEDTEILFQTEDHSLVNDLVKIGELTREEAKSSKQKNVITRAMQPCMERRSKADLYHSEDIIPGDYFMLCSDGILEQLDDDNIKYIFSAKGGDIVNKIDILTKATAHNHDNHSAILVNIVDVEKAASKNDRHVSGPLNSPETESAGGGDAKNEDKGPDNPPHIAKTDREKPRSTVGRVMILCLIGFVIALGGFYVNKKLQKGNGKPASEKTSAPSQVPSSKKGVKKPVAPGQPASTSEQEENVQDAANEEPASAEQPAIQQDSTKEDSAAEPIATTIMDNLNDNDIPSSDEDKAMNLVKNKNRADSLNTTGNQ